jgi:DNA-binding XRE family transcriptional regulator
MNTFSRKVKARREALMLNQHQLGELVGVSKRSIAAYETTDSKPRGNTSQKLASALQVTVDYLFSEVVVYPANCPEVPLRAEETYEWRGSLATKDMETLLEMNRAFFADRALDQESKDIIFEAVLKAYLNCKEESRITGVRRMNKYEK